MGDRWEATCLEVDVDALVIAEPPFNCLGYCGSVLLSCLGLLHGLLLAILAVPVLGSIKPPLPAAWVVTLPKHPLQFTLLSNPFASGQSRGHASADTCVFLCNACSTVVYLISFSAPPWDQVVVHAFTRMQGGKSTHTVQASHTTNGRASTSALASSGLQTGIWRYCIHCASASVYRHQCSWVWLSCFGLQVTYLCLYAAIVSIIDYSNCVVRIILLILQISARERSSDQAWTWDLCFIVEYVSATRTLEGVSLLLFLL